MPYWLTVNSKLLSSKVRLPKELSVELMDIYLKVTAFSLALAENEAHNRTLAC